MPQQDTEPYELFSQEDVQIARPSGKDHQRDQKRRNEHEVDPASNERPQGPARDYAPELTEFAHPKDSMSIAKFLTSFVNDEVHDTKGRRLFVSTSITVIFLIIGASYGLFERFGVTGFARAESIKSKIEDATRPLEQEIAKQTLLLNEVARQLTNQLASSTATQIRSKLERLCADPKPPKADRDQLNQDIADLQDEYFNLKLTSYEPPPCSQL